MKIIKDLWWFFRLEKKRYIIGILALILVAILNLVPPKVMGGVIDRVTSGELTQGQLLMSLFLLVLSAFAMYFLRYIWRMYILGTSYRLGQIMRFRLFDHFTKMSPSFYQKHRTGDLMAHATNDINALTRLAGAGVMSAVDATITAFVTLVTMAFSISWQMTLVAVIPLPFMAYATSRLGRKTHQAFGKSQAAFSELNNKVQESVSGIKVTKSFGYQEDELQSFQEINDMTFVKNMKTMKYDVMFDPLVLLFIGASYVLSLLMGAFMVSAGQVTVGNLVTFITYLDMLVWPLMAIGFLFNMIQRGSVSYNRINRLLKETSDVQESKQPLQTIQNGTLVYDIDSFHYENEETLSDIHFALEQGQTLGLVGQTGSGKTTLIRLLLREYDLTDGRIMLDGNNIKDYKLSDLRRLIGYVPQDQFLFATSILENIRFGNPDASLEKVEAATKLSRVYDDIMATPDGFETLIGEKGVSLSGGQKQRIAMSRAMILDPEILILDDSLSAVDAKTEHAIIENLKQTRQHKSTIITAHRLSAVVHADLILVLQDGHIIERGCHEDLIKQGGWYADTYEAQQLEMEGDSDEE
ncbi:ABC transporter, ATP-binding/permease protein [Streptococcus infantarius subsp. infantarius]|jgi:ATP-binding cassette subfamily B protein|uniref:ABC transporter ATP-binding protein n=1 Tax=Streptococcus infantarius TaxID=102684 RepID=UPI00208F61AF|nr:ABC transporter transmembrane domain-containing protein [Streptococcus infantarius]MCO4465149.1 ABC transporter, ATP-binding/permease protein [Streptococcus infantarius subsp. infantarius]MCO4466390.1 ABC transporter, ATP-binding/permease protein [Streptococcus infantarius subsp. infantarius]MCO4468785.1 ABC transporter, ATP-binding/permease protein [Streptococcus infantarius subsp. infantarius]MCO4475235.1 ABC transporter, ATP-binding/permease protein [Streptococcus infantarius subsp. infan